MKTPHPMFSRVTWTLAVLVLLFSIPVDAGQLVITGTSRATLPLSASHIRVLGESFASYSGTLDPNQSHWSINAHVKDDSFGGYVVGNGKTGVGIQQVMFLHCDPNICGGDKAVSKCTSTGGGNSFTVRGAVATFFSNGTPIIHNQTRAPEDLICPPEKPPIDKSEEGASPLLIDLDRNGFHLTGLDDPVLFDIDGNGVPEMLGWTAADQLDGFLVLDVNRNGVIDGGNELFGNHSWQLDGSKADNGYLALAEYDTLTAGGNEDQAIDASDLCFSQLRVWVDADHDGRSDPGELYSLDEVGITRVDLRYKEHVRTDRHGNELVFQSWTWAKGPGAAEIKLRTTDAFLVNNGLN